MFITLTIFSIFCKAYVNFWPVYNMLYVRYAFTLYVYFCFIGLTGHSHQIFPTAPLVPAKSTRSRRFPDSVSQKHMSAPLICFHCKGVFIPGESYYVSLKFWQMMENATQLGKNETTDPKEYDFTYIIWIDILLNVASGPAEA